MSTKSLPDIAEAIVAQVSGIQAEIKKSLDKQQEEIQAHGKSTEETGKVVAELTTKLTSAVTELDEVKAQLKEVQTAQSRPGRPGGGDERSVGARFVEFDGIKAMQKGSGNDSGPMHIEGAFLPMIRAVDSGSGSAGVLVEPDRRPGILVAPERELWLRQLLNVTPTTSSNIEYIEESGFVNNAAPVAEGALKPKTELTYRKKNAPVEVIAHWAEVTRQIVSDAPRLQGTIDGRMRYGLKVKEEVQLLRGDGSAPNLQGIMTHPLVQQYAWSQGPAPVGETGLTADGQPVDNKVDAIRRAILLARKAEYPATGIVLSPDDKADIDLLKGSDGHYVWVQVPTGGGMVLWMLPVVETMGMAAGEFLTGAFGLGATVYDREETTVRITDSHADYFIRNKLVILVEERVGLTIERPEAFVAGTFDKAPVAAP